MIILPDILFIAVLTLVLVILLVPIAGYRTRRHGASIGVTMLFFFLILFPLIWVSSAWVTPYGPALFGVSWVPMLVAGLLLALLVAAVAPHHRQIASREEASGETATAAITLFGVVFFALLLLGLGVAIAAYL